MPRTKKNMDSLPLTKSKAILPKLIEADKVLNVELDAVKTTAEMCIAIGKYNIVCVEAAEAFYEDTKDRNSKETILQVFCSGKDAQANKEWHFSPKRFKQLITS